MITDEGRSYQEQRVLDAERERALAEKEAAHEPPADAVGLVTAVGYAEREHTPEYVGDPEVVDVIEAVSTVEVEGQTEIDYADKRTEFITDNNSRRTPWPEFVTKDSGEREVFASGMVRDVRTGKGRWDLIPTDGLARVAGLYERGAVKYGPRNWEKGSEFSRYMDSMIRHAFQASAGMTDEDHLAAVAWNALAIMDHQARVARGELPESLNDLPTPVSQPVSE